MHLGAIEDRMHVRAPAFDERGNKYAISIEQRAVRRHTTTTCVRTTLQA